MLFPESPRRSALSDVLLRVCPKNDNFALFVTSTKQEISLIKLFTFNRTSCD